MKQTAVEWLAEQLPIYGYNAVTVFPELIEQAKEIEKQQVGYSEEDMKKAFNAGEENVNNCYTYMPFEEWFETFKNK